MAESARLLQLACAARLSRVAGISFLAAVTACNAPRPIEPSMMPSPAPLVSAVASAAPARAPAASAGSADASAPRGLPEAAIDAAVADAIAAHELPGAVVVIGRHDGVLFRRAYGLREAEPEQVPMTVDTVFDLASLTKPLATATSLMVLVERGSVALDDAVAKYVPECAANGKSAITLRHLLLHVSGLPADTPVSDFSLGRPEIIRRICDARLRAAPGAGSIYSDIGFVLLEEVIRRVTGRELPDFAHEAIYAPLGMRDTGFLPDDEHRRRAAWTELVEGTWRVGVVHDPRAYRLGGVAGHAGLFSTADDVATYARAILGGGAVDGKRVLAPGTVAAMIAPYDVPGSIRALGWSAQSQWRGEGLSPRTVGHFGYTGTAIWIDPDKDLFTVVLTNRVHPDGKGDSKPLVARINTLAAAAIGAPAGRVLACARTMAIGDAGAIGAGVLPGIDVLRLEGFERVRGMRLGLITNASGIARDGTRTIDVLAAAPGVELSAIFSPEHGLGGSENGKVADDRDARTGLPVYSLYGEHYAPSPEVLANLDALLFDVQDVGTRFFTYGSTMLRALEAAAAHGVRFIVLDRPNPIDGVDVAGPVLSPDAHNFVNYHPLPVRHGMTLGELATMFNADEHLGAALSVVTMRGWRREEYGDETGLPWVNPSPNLHDVAEALLYPALGLLEATNLSVGRGTDTPFEHVGAPWIDADALATALRAEALDGVQFDPEVFTPVADRYVGRSCNGVRLTVTDRAHFDPLRTGLALARVLRRLYRGAWEFEKMDRLLGCPAATRAIDQGMALDVIVATYQTDLAAFIAKREKYLLYAPGDCAGSAF